MEQDYNYSKQCQTHLNHDKTGEGLQSYLMAECSDWKRDSGRTPKDQLSTSEQTTNPMGTGSTTSGHADMQNEQGQLKPQQTVKIVPALQHRAQHLAYAYIAY